jgi:hypothetical protein
LYQYVVLSFRLGDGSGIFLLFGGIVVLGTE